MFTQSLHMIPAQSSTSKSPKQDKTTFVKSCFFLLAGGTLPVLFMKPIDYLLALGCSYLMAKTLHRVLF